MKYNGTEFLKYKNGQNLKNNNEEYETLIE